MAEKVIDRFFRYVQIDTQSKEDAESFPSTEKQKNLATLLAKELQEMGASDVIYDEERCYVYAKLPGNDPAKGDNYPTLGFIAHMDTSPDCSGKNVKPKLIENYDGKEVILNEEKAIVLSPVVFPELKHYVGQTLIVTDGTTLLGADDKAGVAEIMTMVQTLLEHPEIKHGPIAIGFTPDEEVGDGVDHFKIRQFGADYAYTVDGGAIGELEYENFNAASARAIIHGVNVHPGEAKNKMKNASLYAMEFQMMLPGTMRPECTDGYEGFFHLTNMEGTVELATLSYIIRDHDKERFHEKKELFRHIANEMNTRYGEGTVEVEISDSYYNMKEKIEPENLFLIENAKSCMEELGIVPKIQPIRGGTDGARLSFLGLPCPNLCTGGHNYHGRFEYCVVESMEKIVELLVHITQRELK